MENIRRSAGVSKRTFNKEINKKAVKEGDLFTKVDLSLPIHLWDLTESLTERQSGLKKLSDLRRRIEFLNRKLSDMKKDKDETLDGIRKEGNNSIVLRRDEIDKTILTGDQQIKRNKKDILESKENEINKAMDNYYADKENYANERKQECEDYLKNYFYIKKSINEIVKRYGIKLPNTTIIPPLELSEDELEPDLIWELVDYISTALKESIEGSESTGKKLTNKVKGMSKGTRLVTGSALAIGTALFAPAVILGAGVSVGVMARKTLDERKEIESYCIKLLQLKETVTQVMAHYEEEFHKEFDDSDLERLLKINLKEIEERYNTDIKELELSAKRWYDTKKELEEEDYQSNIERETENKLNETENIFDEKIYKLESDLNSATKKSIISSKILNASNELININDRTNFDLFAKINGGKDTAGNSHFGVKKVLQKYAKFDLMKDGSVSQEKLTEVLKEYDPEKYDRIEYDQKDFKPTFEELKKELGTYAQGGKDKKAFENDYRNLINEETKLYCFEDKKVNIGVVVQNKGIDAGDKKEYAFADRWGGGSVLFVYKNEEEMRALQNLVKYIIQQEMASMHPSSLVVNICSERPFPDFNDIAINTSTLTKEGKEKKNPEYSKVYFGKGVEELSNDLQFKLKKMQSQDLAGGKSFRDLVLEKRARFSRTPNYTINVVHHSPTSQLFSLNNYSKTSGIMNYILMDRRDIIDMKEDSQTGEPVYTISETAKTMFSGVETIIETSMLAGGELLLNEYNKNEREYRTITYNVKTKEEIITNTETLSNRFKENLKNNSITLIDEYVLEVTGGKKWYKDATKQIELYFGYVDGDKSKPMPVILDAKDKPHMFIGGTTGGGKSVTLSVMVNCLKQMYSPEELQIYYFDFKVVEVGIHAKPYKWVNARALSGSNEAEYVISLMRKVEGEMKDRQALFDKIGVTNYQEYKEVIINKRNKLIESGRPDLAKKVPLMPRILIIIDEFVAGFTDETTEDMKDVVEQLTRLARAAGLNLLAVAQDPGTKIPPNIFDLFKVRACTVASKDVSKSVMKNDFCARPENQFIGFLGANDSGTGEEEKNIQYVVPLSEKEHSKMFSKLGHDYCKKFDVEPVDAVIFSDTDPYPLEKLVQDITEPDFQINPQEIFLGEKIKFLELFRPASITLTSNSGNNIAHLSSSITQKENFLHAVCESIKLDKNNPKVLFFYSKGRYPNFDERDYFSDDKFKVAFNEIFFGLSPYELMRKYPIDEEAVKYLGERSPKSDILANTDFSSIEYFDGDVTREYITGFTEEDYLNPPKEYSKKKTSEDMSFTGRLYCYIMGLESYQKTLLPNYDYDPLKLPPLYLFIVDPENDATVTSDNFFGDRYLQSMLSSLCSFNIHTIVITSKSKEVDRGYCNHIVVVDSPKDERMMIDSKGLKNLEEGTGKYLNKVTPSLSFKFKPAGNENKEKLPWEIDGEDIQ